MEPLLCGVWMFNPARECWLCFQSLCVFNPTSPRGSVLEQESLEGDLQGGPWGGSHGST